MGPIHSAARMPALFDKPWLERRTPKNRTQGNKITPSGRVQAATAPVRQACHQSASRRSMEAEASLSKLQAKANRKKVSGITLRDHCHNKGEKSAIRQMMADISMGTQRRES